MVGVARFKKYKKNFFLCNQFQHSKLKLFKQSALQGCVSGCAGVRESGHLQAWSAAAGRRQGTRQGRGRVESCGVNSGRCQDCSSCCPA